MTAVGFMVNWDLMARTKNNTKDRPPFKAGDVIGFSGHSWWSDLINLATYGVPGWGLSHLGIVAEYEEEFPSCQWDDPLYSPNLLLFESTMACNLPDVFDNEIIKGFQAHNLSLRLTNYSGKVWHYPLVEALRPLESRRLTRFLLDQRGKDYDAIGAFRAGGIGFSYIESLLRPEDLSSLFCSEVVAAAHAHIGLLDTRNASRWNPNHFVRTERKRKILMKSFREK